MILQKNMSICKEKNLLDKMFNTISILKKWPNKM